MGGDPVAFGLVDSLNHPGSNVTGITLVAAEIVSKRIALLRDLLPDARRFGVLANATTSASEVEAAEADRVARTLGWQVQVVKVSKELDLTLLFNRWYENGQMSSL
jgi:putative ABC transport system substrate-binding protein